MLQNVAHIFQSRMAQDFLINVFLKNGRQKPLIFFCFFKGLLFPICEWVGGGRISVKFGVFWETHVVIRESAVSIIYSKQCKNYINSSI